MLSLMSTLGAIGGRVGSLLGLLALAACLLGASLFAEGFEVFNTVTQALRKWTTFSGPSGVSWVSGRFSGQALSFSTSVGGSFTTKSLGGNYSTLIAGFALQVPTGQVFAANDKVFEFLDGASVQVGIALDASGHIFLYSGTTSTVIATSTQTLTIGNWAYLELKVTFSNSGSYELRLDGQTILSGSADTTATANSYATTIRLQLGVSAHYLDDLYVVDTSGSHANDFLGDSRVFTAYPNGAGTYSDYASSSGGANYTNVDEAQPNDDTDYNSDSTAGHRDTYALDNVPAGAAPSFVQLNLQARKDDAGGRHLLPTLISGGTVEQDPQVDLTTSYACILLRRDVDPHTGSAWTESAANALEAGVETV